MAHGAGAAGAAVVQAIKASGAIVHVEPSQFSRILRQMDSPVIVHAPGGFLSAKHHYLTSYKGLAFYTKSPDTISLPSGAEVFEARAIWAPG